MIVDINRELDSYRYIKENWDGEGAEPPSQESISAATQFITYLKNKILPEPVLHVSGRVSLVWSTENIYIDVEFYSNNIIGFYIELKDKYPIKGQHLLKNNIPDELNSYIPSCVS